VFDPKYIAIEGVIGAGKTTLAKMLSEELKAELLLDDAMNNPFLADFYKNPARHALSTQLFFLMSRYQQQQRLITRDLFQERIIADYTFARDRIFAQVTLSRREMALYEKLLPTISAEVPDPDLTIYLQTSTPILIQRIRRRNLHFERCIDAEYLETLNEAFNYYFFHYDEGPLLVIKTDDIDFVNNEDDFKTLLELIKKPIVGKKYYIPAGSAV
jgi:deoxyguanosine kinase